MKEKNKAAVKELVELLEHKDKNIQSDCIKVLDEIGKINPAMVSSYCKIFIDMLENKNNRMVWGTMCVLDSIVDSHAELIFKSLVKIVEASDKGSVITKDHAVNILIKLSGDKQYTKTTFPLLIEQLKFCPGNQLPMYAENAAPIINVKNKQVFIETISARIKEMQTDSKKKRIEKVVKQLS